ncbi:MAG TPA: hypothetical protein VEF04_06380, partial [Blastocatellia bacterium]|nr:hypothetical protein [Blastocatellia bacterium]
MATSPKSDVDLSVILRTIEGFKAKYEATIEEIKRTKAAHSLHARQAGQVRAMLNKHETGMKQAESKLATLETELQALAERKNALWKFVISDDGMKPSSSTKEFEDQSVGQSLKRPRIEQSVTVSTDDATKSLDVAAPVARGDLSKKGSNPNDTDVMTVDGDEYSDESDMENGHSRDDLLCVSGAEQRWIDMMLENALPTIQKVFLEQSRRGGEDVIKCPKYASSGGRSRFKLVPEFRSIHRIHP